MALAHEPESLDPRLRLLRAAGDGARLALIDRLCHGEASVGALVAHLGLPQPLVSRHLRILREAGWLRDERRGQRVYYRLDSDALLRVRRWSADLPLTALAAAAAHVKLAAGPAAEPATGVLFVD